MADNFESEDRPDDASAAAPRAATDLGKKLQNHANLITSLVFVALTVVWLVCMPWSWRSKYDLPPEIDLCSRIQKAEIAAQQQPVLLPAGCPSLPSLKSSNAAGGMARMGTPVSWARLVPASTAGAAEAPGGGGESLQEMKNDLTVWNRYEYELKTFVWGKT